MTAPVDPLATSSVNGSSASSSQFALPAATNQPVPLIDVGRQNGALAGELDAALRRVIEHGGYVLGPEVKTLEDDIAAYCGVEHAIGCASGSDALLLALMAADVGEGDEVLVPSYTFFATASAVMRVGARPVFVDIDPLTFNIDPAELERLTSERTRAIIPVHLFGQAAAMDEILDFAVTHELTVIEDAAQALGAEFRGQRVGSIGDIACFSFYPTKNLGGVGDGGMVTTRHTRLAERLRMLRVHGERTRYYHEVVGINSRLDTLQAAALCVKLPYLDRWSDERGARAARYQELFSKAGLDRVLGLPQAAAERRHVWNQYIVRVLDGRRDALRQHLGDRQIGTQIYYPRPLHLQECFASLGYVEGSLPLTERAAMETVALPIFPELTDEEQRRVVAEIAAFFAS
ncbi:MAG: DegT/DnrJ/EryC1/StrS family aminotransferase [Planctomycetales bacterium]|nr:DegT/DnrJ/EryC1/StrS family aminotransferase [Planctomycetales bacterium]